MAALGTPSSSTLENAVIEIAQKLQAKQANTATNPDDVTVVNTLTFDAATGQISLSITMPASASVDATSGAIVFDATEVYS